MSNFEEFQKQKLLKTVKGRLEEYWFNKRFNSSSMKIVPSEIFADLECFYCEEKLLPTHYEENRSLDCIWEVGCNNCHINLKFRFKFKLPLDEASVNIESVTLEISELIKEEETTHKRLKRRNFKEWGIYMKEQLKKIKNKLEVMKMLRREQKILPEEYFEKLTCVKCKKKENRVLSYIQKKMEKDIKCSVVIECTKCKHKTGCVVIVGIDNLKIKDIEFEERKEFLS